MDGLARYRSRRRFADLCRELYALSQHYLAARPQSPADRGRRWEALIADVLSARGFPVESVPGGVRVHGVLPASGLQHQTDAAVTCSDALVIGEWKSYVGTVPKNEILRFKAVTDDLYVAMSDHPPRRAVYRLFGVAGDASDATRWYATRHGIALVERSRWPAPVLSDPLLRWPAGDGPNEIDRRRLAWLSRPLQAVYPRMSDGSLRLPRRLPGPAVDALLRLHDYWSDRYWSVVEAVPGSFEEYAARLAA